MGKFGVFELIAIAAIAVVILALYKLVRSDLSIWEKVVWILALVLLNVVAAIAFIIYHDYFLAFRKRSTEAK
jgi:tellurite resistance protein TehA-like permease